MKKFNVGDVLIDGNDSFKVLDVYDYKGDWTYEIENLKKEGAITEISNSEINRGDFSLKKQEKTSPLPKYKKGDKIKFLAHRTEDFHTIRGFMYGNECYKMERNSDGMYHNQPVEWIDKKENTRLVNVSAKSETVTVVSPKLLKEKLEDFYMPYSEKEVLETDDEDIVKRAAHYNQHKIEVIEIIDDYKLNFNLGNAVKYILRAPYKGVQIQDLKKAAQYLEFEINRLETGSSRRIEPEEGLKYEMDQEAT